MATRIIFHLRVFCATTSKDDVAKKNTQEIEDAWPLIMIDVAISRVR